MSLSAPANPPALLVAAVAGLLVVSVTTAFGYEPPRTERVAVTPSSTTSTTEVQTTTSAPGTLLPVTTSTTSASSPSTTVAASTTSTSGATSGPVAPGAARRPAAGFYRYIVALDDDEDITKVEVEIGPGTRIRTTDHDQGSIDDGTWTELGHTIGSTGDATGEDETAGCDWKPDITALKFPMGVGTSWSAESTCSFAHEEGSSTIHFSGTFRVQRAERVVIDDVAADVWVIDQRTKTVVDGGFEGDRFQSTYEEIAAVRFSPAHGVVVSSQIQRKVREVYAAQGEEPEDESYEEAERRELMSLTPKAR